MDRLPPAEAGNSEAAAEARKRERFLGALREAEPLVAQGAESFGAALVAIETEDLAEASRSQAEGMRALALGGAEVIVVPTATASMEEQFRAVWEFEMQAAAVANGVFVAVANRAGVDDTLTFFGGSFAADPYGQVVARAPQDDVSLTLVDLDLDLVEEARRDMPFLRDRRLNIYNGRERVLLES